MTDQPWNHVERKTVKGVDVLTIQSDDAILTAARDEVGVVMQLVKSEEEFHRVDMATEAERRRMDKMHGSAVLREALSKSPRMEFTAEGLAALVEFLSDVET